MRYVILIILFGVQISCTSRAPQIMVRWSGQGAAPAPPDTVVHSRVKQIAVGGKQLDFQIQKIDGVEIEGSYFKKISQDGKPEFMTYSWVNQVPLMTEMQLLTMKAGLPFVSRAFFTKYPEYLLYQEVGTPELVLKKDLQIQCRFLFQKKDGTLLAVFTDSGLEIQKQMTVGSHLTDATGFLFPEGPLRSGVQQVLLHNMLGDQTLSSSLVKVETQSNKIAISNNGQFNYPVDDGRFLQVQAFYYLSQSLAWFQQNMNFRLPFLLEAETDVGFPDKTNTAFYFQHKIRLGEGDGQVFAKMPLDPSIVIHESIHGVIEAVAGLPYQGEGGSLNEGFADYFTTVQLNNPNLGEVSYKQGPFKRTVDNNLRPADKTGGLYHDSGIISGLLWNLQKEMGPSEANKIAWEILLRLTPQSDFKSFSTELHAVITTLDSTKRKESEEILKQKGWED